MLNAARALLPIVAVLGAFSQQPISRPAKTGEPPSAQADTRKAALETPLPAPSPVQPMSSGKPDQDAQHSSADGWLALFTFGLLIVAILQWRTFEKHADLFKASGGVMEEQLAVMKKQEQWLLESARTVKEQRVVLEQAVFVLGNLNAKESRWESTFKAQMIRLIRAVRQQPPHDDEPK